MAGKETKERKLTVGGILLSLLGFVILWAVLTDAWGYSARIPLVSGGMLYALLSRLIWVAPALWLIFRHEGALEYGRRALFSSPVMNMSLVLVLSAAAVAVLCMMVSVHGGLWLNESLDLLPALIKLAAAGVVEEIVLRGWGYNALCRATTEKNAALYSTVFFVLLHWPAFFIRLIRIGALDVPAFLTQTLTAAIWGLVFCWLMKKGKTLWNPVLVHVIYDMLYLLLVGG